MLSSLAAVDCAIVDALQHRGDVANADLARAVGLSPAATLRRVTRLRAEGVITGVHARVDPERVGAALQAFVLVVLDEHDEDSARRFAEAVAQMPQVVRADAVAVRTTCSCTWPQPGRPTSRKSSGHSPASAPAGPRPSCGWGR